MLSFGACCAHAIATAFTLDITVPDRATAVVQLDRYQFVHKLVELELKLANSAMRISEKVLQQTDFLDAVQGRHYRPHYMQSGSSG
jgi:hypothetical protein